MAMPFSLVAQDLSLQTDEWNRAAMDWVALLKEGDFEGASARVDPAVPQDAFSPHGLETIWTQLEAQLGPLATLSPGTVSEHQAYHIVDLPAAFRNQEVVLRVVLTEELEISGFFVRPPEPPAYEVPGYVNTDAFSEVEITVGEEPWSLPGILSIPEGRGPFPAVVLVHGSGPNDGDETVGGNRPFRDLAWGLASRGLAVIRYDKRTRVHGGTLPQDMGLDQEVVEDALAALSLARGREEVRPDSVFLLGHSLGGMLAPEIARRDGNLTGVAILAAPARPFLDVLRDQLEYVASLQSSGTPARRQLDSILTEVDRAATGEMDEEEPILGVRRGYWRELEMVKPVSTALALSVPILVLQGGRDYQSTPGDFRLWEEGLAGREGVAMKLYPHLNHLFAPGEGKATPSEYTSQVKHVDPEVISDLARWIREGHISDS